MGFFSDLFGSNNDPEKIAAIAEELGRYADRFENADDQENAALARGYAERVRKVKTVNEAKALKAEFLAITGKDTGHESRDRDYDRTRYDRDNQRYSDDS